MTIVLGFKRRPQYLKNAFLLIAFIFVHRAIRHFFI